MRVFLAMSGLVPIDGNSRGDGASGCGDFLISYSYLSDTDKSFEEIAAGMCDGKIPTTKQVSNHGQE